LSVAERVYKDIKITVILGDITKLEVDAVVNPANSMLIMGGGVAGAILRAVEEKSKKKPQNKRLFRLEKPWQHVQEN